MFRRKKKEPACGHKPTPVCLRKHKMRNLRWHAHRTNGTVQELGTQTDGSNWEIDFEVTHDGTGHPLCTPGRIFVRVDLLADTADVYYQRPSDWSSGDGR